ncbi:hypothetical protein [Rubripirellula tenax]|uniref:hypothetical protein n=1 Tax=Rubripirellula tenax TaxID=2528015 RepID=UPI0011B5AB6B|nr:hypothetical protein [Rubripirellula tenax]
MTADASRFRVLPDTKTIDLHQYTLSFEKTFADGLASIDIRMPFANQLALDTPNFGSEGGRIGNLNGKLKFLFLSNEDFALSGGIGLDIPTGSDFAFQGNGLQYRVSNDAFFVQPFLAYEERFDQWFVNVFSSLDVALNGNTFRRDQVARSADGKINDQTLLILSAGAGRWVWTTPGSTLLDGVAIVSELHYTTTLQDSDSVADSFFIQNVSVSNLSNRSDHLNFTVGSHLAFGLSSLRFGYVQPLRGGDDRVFDSELSVQFNRVF